MSGNVVLQRVSSHINWEGLQIVGCNLGVKLAYRSSKALLPQHTKLWYFSFLYNYFSGFSQNENFLSIIGKNVCSS